MHRSIHHHPKAVRMSSFALAAPRHYTLETKAEREARIDEQTERVQGELKAEHERWLGTVMTDPANLESQRPWRATEHGKLTVRILRARAEIKDIDRTADPTRYALRRAVLIGRLEVAVARRDELAEGRSARDV